MGPKGIQAKHTRTTMMLSKPNAAGTSSNTDSMEAANALIKASALGSSKHKSPHKDLMTGNEKAGMTAGSEKSAAGLGNSSEEEEMAELMSAFCYRVSKAPTCMVPAPDPNVGMGNGVKGSDLAKRLRQEMTASSKDEKQSLGADDGGQEGKKAAADSGRQHSNWAYTCLWA